MGNKSDRARKYIRLFLACLIALFLFNCALFKDWKPKPQEDLQRGQALLSQRDYEGALIAYEKVLSFTPRQPLEDQALFGIAMIYAHFGNPKRDYKKSIDYLLRIVNEYPQSPLVEQAMVWVGVLVENMEFTRKVEKLYETIQNMEKIKHSLRESQKGRPPETRFEEQIVGRELLNQSHKFLAQGNFEGAIGENQKILSSPDPRSPKAEALFNLGLIFAHFENPQRDIEKSIEFFNRLLNTYPKSLLIEQAKTCIGILQENEELNRLIKKLKQVDIEVEEMKRKRLK